ncbi:alpha/beta hydrolase [Frigoribacterium sp. CG_9.8]|uniref:alpha/beta hydrolase n=1 Tax=Frigoribacterium sp. CG_9.8 TaxID=2787733 RepID=UPI0018CA5125|nr:alpha/beta hydrolase-fold protein [Frigoribacterium sp. CG_9.8]MBG6107139.1 phospholipase/carboxylesterase [Frigoribacterium sp. CG_9.8]
MRTDTELAAWPHLYRPGTGPVLLMLHGTGGSEIDMLGLSDEIDPAAAVIAPRGQVLEGGALRWFRRLSEGVFDVDDVVFRAGSLAEFVGWAASAYDLSARKIVAAGFSNGANIALATGILSPGLFDTTIAFSGMYPFGARAMSTHPAGAPVGTASTGLDVSQDVAGSQDVAVSTELAAQRFVLLNGDSDPMAPVVSVDRLVAELTRTGADVARHTRTGGHGITSDDLRIARAAYRAAAARGGGS